MFDINKLTMGEVASVERIGNAAITSFGSDTQPQGELMTGLAFVIKRRQDPSWTLAQAQALTLGETMDIVRAAGEPDEPEEIEAEPQFDEHGVEVPSPLASESPES